MELITLKVVDNKCVVVNPAHVVMIMPYSGKTTVGDPEYQATVYLADSHFVDTVLTMDQVVVRLQGNC